MARSFGCPSSNVNLFSNNHLEMHFIGEPPSSDDAATMANGIPSPKMNLAITNMATLIGIRDSPRGQKKRAHNSAMQSE